MNRLFISASALEWSSIMITFNLQYSTMCVCSEKNQSSNASNFINCSKLKESISWSEPEKGDIWIYSPSTGPIHKGKLSSMSGIFFLHQTIEAQGKTTDRGL